MAAYNGGQAKPGGAMSQIFFTKSKQRPSAFSTLGLMIVFLAAVTLLGAVPVLGFIQQSSTNPEEIYLWRFKLLELANLLLLGGSAVTLAGILHGRLSSRVRTSWRGFLAVALAIFVAAPLWLFDQVTDNTLPLHDITTNLEDPPYFMHLAERSYDTGRTEALQGGRLDMNYMLLHRQSFPDLKPLVMNARPEQSLEALQRAAARLGWKIENQSKQYLQLEASYIHPLLQLRSNIVMRLRPIAAGEQSTLDIRALSLLGVSDYGMNARLIRDFLLEIREDLALAPPENN